MIALLERELIAGIVLQLLHGRVELLGQVALRQTRVADIAPSGSAQSEKLR